MQRGKKTHLMVYQSLIRFLIYVSLWSRNWYSKMDKTYKLELKSGLNKVEHNEIIETASKIINKQGKNCGDLC